MRTATRVWEKAVMHRSLDSLWPRNSTWVSNVLNRRFGSSKYMPHQGPKECARRVKQMAKAAKS